MFDSNLIKICGQIEEAAANRQRHWLRITRCALHEHPHRVMRIASLTKELDLLYAEKRQIVAGK